MVTHLSRRLNYSRLPRQGMGPSAGARFSDAPLKALSIVHTPLHRLLSGVASNDGGKGGQQKMQETTPTSSPPAPWSSSYESTYHPVLFGTSQPRQALDEGLVSTQHARPPSETP